MLTIVHSWRLSVIFMETPGCVLYRVTIQPNYACEGSVFTSWHVRLSENESDQSEREN